MRFVIGFAAWVAAIVALFAAQAAQAADIPRPLTSGTVDVKIQAVGDPSSLDIKSLSARVAGGGAQVFCKNLADEQDPAVSSINAVAGTTAPIAATALTVRLEGIAWSGDDCGGVPSAASADLYSVTFNPPLAPVLMP